MLLAILVSVAGPAAAAPVARPPLILVDAPAAPGLSKKLHDEIMAKFEAMNGEHRGIFHDDVTGIVAPYFPKGQPFAETQKVLREQHFEELHPFKGKSHTDGTTMYVSRMNVMSEMFSDVHVVLDFDFEGGSEQDMKVKAVSAFLQSASM